MTSKVLFDWQIGRAPRGNVRSATEWDQNQGTIKLLVQAVGLKPKIVCQSFTCYTFTMDNKGEHITRERAGFLSGQYMTDGLLFSSAVISGGWEGESGDTRFAMRW